jgi:rubrerythrin
MSPISRASALKLATTAHDLGAEALRGTLERDAAGRWNIGHIELDAWMSRHEGHELVLLVAEIGEQTSQGYRRTCRTCGNEFEGSTCPHCDAVRSRLRGR